MITVIGNLTRDVEIKYFESGTVKATFGVAVNEWDFKTKENKAVFFNCETWGKTAEYVSAHFKKGENAILNGFLKRNDYEKDGEKRTFYTLNCDKVQKFTGAFIEISGDVEKVETRVSTNDKKIQFIKLGDYTIKHFGASEILQGDSIIVSGTLTMDENKPLINATRIITSKEKVIGKFASEEIVNFDDMEELPF